jgi:hypothetical protein
MRTAVTNISTEIVGENVTIHTVQNSQSASITIPAGAAVALAGLLTAGVDDSITAPSWMTPSAIRAARIEKGEYVPAD